MKLSKILFALFFCTIISGVFTACNENSVSTTPQILTVEGTRIEQLSSTPQTLRITEEATRAVRMDRTVVMTPTPEPLLAKDCFDSAMTQGAMNDCAILEYQLALKELDEIIAQIKISGKDTQDLEQIQKTWQKQMEHECVFLAGRTTTDENGNLNYIGGSMAPMNVRFCMANRTKQRIKELAVVMIFP